VATALSEVEIAVWRRRFPDAFGRPLRQRLLRAGAWLLFIVLVLAALWRVDADPLRLWNGLFKLGYLLRLMIPPDTGGALLEFLGGLAETLAMAFLGTLLAALIALPLGFLGAKNILPHSLFRFGLRRFFDGLRAVDQLVWALIFVAAVGMGPFAGILAIAAGDIGVFAKLFAETIENIDRRPVEGVRAVGAGRLTTLRYAVLPQVLPVFLSNALYLLESNTRSATILGIVGAGGIGLFLADRIGANDWDVVATLIIMVLITVSLIDMLSARLRRAVIGPAVR
jgi:phosphonate transport system permease protein